MSLGIYEVLIPATPLVRMPAGRLVSFARREDQDDDVQSKRDRRIVLQHRVATITEYMEQRAKGKWITGRKISDSTGIKAVIVARVLTYMRETLRSVESEGKPGDALVWRLRER